MSSFLTYADTIKTIAKTISDNQKGLEDIKKYFEDLSVSFENLLNNLSKTKSIVDQNGGSQNGSGEYYRLWCDLVKLCGTDALAEPIKSIRNEAAKEIGAVLEGYQRRSIVIVQRGKDMLGNLKKADDLRRANFKAYEIAGKELNDAFKTNSPNLDEVRERFVKVQKAAIKSHNNNNNQRAAASLTLDRILSDYESVEMWRAEETRKGFVSFARALRMIGETYVKRSEELKAGLDKVNMVETVNNLKFSNDIKNPIENKDFTVPEISQLAQKLISINLLYKDEMANGAVLMKAVQDYSPQYQGEIGVKKGEAIIVTSLDGDYVSGHNRDGLSGIIPLQVLEPVE